VLLLTGATGTVGRALLGPLLDAGTPVRCLVRDPRRLGSDRVRVQIALGDLGDHLSFRHALRGVDTVVHLASVIRDQPHGSIEELSGVATWRLVQAAERAGVSRFVFFSTLGASTRSRGRLMRAKAVAESAVAACAIAHTVFAPSIIYAPGDPYLRLLHRMSWLPVMAIPGSGQAAFQPISADDVAACVMAALPGGACADAAVNARYQLAGPETLTHREIVAAALGSFGRRRRIVSIPLWLTRWILQTAELLGGAAAFATWDEAELLEIPLVSPRGTADAQSLGVTPRRMDEVLGSAPPTAAIARAAPPAPAAGPPAPAGR
jgi:NADH dehydrogenase